MIWGVLAGVLTILFLVSLVRVGVRVEYDDGQMRIRLRVGAIGLRIYPIKKNAERSPVKPELPPKQSRTEPDTRGKAALLWELLPAALHAAGALRRKILIDPLKMHILLAGSDPAALAVAFGGVNGIIGMVLPLLEQNFHIHRQEIRTAVDFQRVHSEIQIEAAMSLTVGQGLILSLHFGWEALGVLLRWRRNHQTDKRTKHTTERAVEYGKEPSHQ